ncbi:unnamed protein product [Diatraea saccharalis]|uniref:Uncharacterized protein n=1 Tax=Diatraea saccharalis TaxID=40085 RepID=A0A9N9MZC2_9NEOP|nr:unnamed protein product [Diatraea saccharalis]
MEVIYTAPPAVVIPSTEDLLYHAEVTSTRGFQQASEQPSVHGSTRGSIHGSVHGSTHSSAPQSDDDNELENIERNIASLERSLQNKDIVIDLESGDESRTRKLKIVGKRFLRVGQGKELLLVLQPRTNASVLTEVKIKMRLSTTCLRRSFEFFGHIVRKEGDNLKKTLMTGRIDGRIPRGRSPLHWSDQIRTPTTPQSARVTTE